VIIKKLFFFANNLFVKKFSRLMKGFISPVRIFDLTLKDMIVVAFQALSFRGCWD